MPRRRAFGRGRLLTRDYQSRVISDPAELAATWAAFRETRSEEHRNRLIEHYLTLVRYSAEAQAAKLPDEVDVEDLMSAGIFGLLDSINAFDPDRGVKFETYCAPRIRGAILDELRSLDWVPRLVRHRAGRIDETVRALEAELGRAPTEDELRRRLNVTPQVFEKFTRDSSAVSLISLSARMGDSDSSREMSELDVLRDEDSRDPVAEAQKADLREVIEQELTRAEKLIIVLYYFEQMTMKEIGATLDLSESRVSQMHSAIVERLRDQLALHAPPPTSPTDLVA